MIKTPDARNRILSAAAKVFAEKSFAGARIDDVANSANVPKSLIYYHFKSKEDILMVLIHNFLVEYRLLLETTKNDSHESKMNNLNHHLTDNHLNFLDKNTDLIRIILTESLKKNHSLPEIFKVVEELVSHDGEEMKAHPAYDLNERLIAEFFTSLIPLYSFLCFREGWSEYFNISPDDLSQRFMDIMAQTHGTYHKNNII